jgi:hypothetical protein
VKTSPPRDRRILIWFKGHAVYGKEHGWFTAQYDPPALGSADTRSWRIGLNNPTVCTWVDEDDIGGWHELPPDLKHVSP